MAVVSGVPDPPPLVHPSELTFPAVDTRPPFMREYLGSDGGVAHPWRMQRVGPR
ncbi:MAG: hypothetical protein V1790_12690 [Planctomycetota bacterium]